jgi:endogenous inhibitor of DNA gyrase (YacG/DUF329 family)
MDTKNFTCRACKEEVERQGNRHYPFCSARCRSTDLGRWFGEEYRMPAPITERDIDHLIHVMENGGPDDR